MPSSNVVSNLFASLPSDRRALVALGADGARHEWTFGEIDDLSCRFAGSLRARGVARGDVVMTLIGNRPEWVLTLVACWRIGAVALPCNEQLRPHDLERRIAATEPRLAVCDERDRAALEAAGFT